MKSHVSFIAIPSFSVDRKEPAHVLYRQDWVPDESLELKPCVIGLSKGKGLSIFS